MRCRINERDAQIERGTSLGNVAAAHCPGADLFILNGCPVTPETIPAEGDAIVFIRRGAMPAPEELDALLAARHTPGVHEKLKKASVGIAGCGGLGSTVALALARVGIGRLVLADHDVVEPSNLNRQQYYIDQIGLPKVEALRTTITRVNPTVQVTIWGERLVPPTVASLFAGVDVLVEALDRADQKAMLVEAAMKAFPAKPLVLGSGMAGWGGNDRLRTRISGTMTVCGDETAEAVPGRGLMAPRVGIVAHMQANRVMELLLGPDEGFGPELVTGRFDETC
ncbi:MAG TPA: sulfur carrier protein ThiS adenylyltransferase ThiF [Candidatus Ozemobacteraceae bacterium]|nr:sulfur carrier protein ThiS adenylyltransferase ThiF [Candidatus Ozemobacteraceae bacterium]